MKQVQFYDVPNETGAVMGQVKFDPFRKEDLWSAYFGKEYLGDFESYSNAVEAMEEHEFAKDIGYTGRDDMVDTMNESYIPPKGEQGGNITNVSSWGESPQSPDLSQIAEEITLIVTDLDDIVGAGVGDNVIRVYLKSEDSMSAFRRLEECYPSVLLEPVISGEVTF